MSKQAIQDKRELEVKSHKTASDKAYKEAKKTTADFNKLLLNNNFYLRMVLSVGDKRRK